MSLLATNYSKVIIFSYHGCIKHLYTIKYLCNKLLIMNHYKLDVGQPIVANLCKIKFNSLNDIQENVNFI